MSKQIVDQDQLIKLAGKECYQRGLAGFATLSLENFQSGQGRMEAEIDGYHVKLRFNGDMVEGNCTCPVSDGFDFCHHCVQLVLYSNKRVRQLMSLSKGPDKSKIFAYLLEQDKQTLVKQFLDFLEADSEQFDRYLLRANLASDDTDMAGLRQRVTELTRVVEKHGLFSQRQVKVFFHKMEVFFGELANADLVSNHEPALKLIEYAIARVNQILLVVDDKWGYREPVFECLKSSFSRLFDLLEGRDGTLVKRFEKIFFIDRFQVLGEIPEPYLSRHPSLMPLFKLRMQALWANHIGCKLSLNQTDQKLLSTLPDINEAWQWRKLAVYLSKIELPKTQDRFKWTRSIKEHLLLGPEAWFAWIEEVERDFGSEASRQCALDALKLHPTHSRLIQKCADLLHSQGKSELLLQPLFEANPIALLEWMQGLDESKQKSLPEQLPMHLLSSIKQMPPRHDLDEPLARGCEALLLWLKKHRVPEVERAMAFDPELPSAIRIELVRTFDQYDPATAIAVREKLIPQLLGKNQNKTDRLAAEQTVLLKKNIASQGLGDDALERILLKFESLIRQRSNFIQLVQQYSQKEVSLND